jgi:hypothetical protein
MNRLLVFLLYLFLATVMGCGGDRQTYAKVKGTVTYNGKPLDKGEITFTVEGKPPTVIDIVDGKFGGQAVVGSNRISFSALRKSATAPKLTKEAEIQIKGYKEYMKGKSDGGGPSGQLSPGMEDYIPPEWGSASKQMRVVESGAANEFDFNIKASN